MPATESIKKSLLYILPILLYLIFYYLMMPKMIILRSDDFGYLDSLLKSLNMSKIVTSEWLEPINFVSTFISVITYKIFGNFFIATFGTVFIFSLVNFILLLKLFSDAFGKIKGILFTFFLVTSPVYLNISLDFTGVMATWTLFLSSVVIWRRKYYFLFFILAFLAFSNRQSSIVLIIFPLYQIVKEYFSRHKINLYLTSLILIYSISVAILISFINTTIAQAQLIDTVVASLLKHFFRGTTSVFVMGLFFIPMFIFFYQLIDAFGWTFSQLKFTSKKIFILLVGFSLFIAVFYISYGEPLSIQTPIIGHLPIAPIFTIILLWFLIAVWFFPWSHLIVSEILLVLYGYIILTAIRGAWWDYYFWEVLILCFFYYIDIRSSVKSLKVKSRFSNLSIIILSALLLLNIGFGYLFKIDLDINELKIRKFESILRLDGNKIRYISGAPYGYLGFKLFNFHINNYPDDYLGNFRCCMSNNSYDVRNILPWSHLTNDNVANIARDVIEKGGFSIGFTTQQYFIIRPQYTEPYEYKCQNLSDYCRRITYPNKIYPLNEKEWSELINQL